MAPRLLVEGLISQRRRRNRRWKSNKDGASVRPGVGALGVDRGEEDVEGTSNSRKEKVLMLKTTG